MMIQWEKNLDLFSKKEASGCKKLKGPISHIAANKCDS